MDKVSREKRSEIMSKIRSKNTKFELSFMEKLSEVLGIPKEKIRYQPTIEVDGKKIKADFEINGVYVFLDSCFWHGCPKHFKLPKTNSDFWKRHIGASVERDKKVNKLLKRHNIPLVRIWEHEVKDGTFVEKIKKAFEVIEE